MLFFPVPPIPLDSPASTPRPWGRCRGRPSHLATRQKHRQVVSDSFREIYQLAHRVRVIINGLCYGETVGSTLGNTLVSERKRETPTQRSNGVASRTALNDVIAQRRSESVSRAKNSIARTIERQKRNKQKTSN